MHRLVCSFLAGLCLLSVHPGTAAAQMAPSAVLSNEEIQKILEDRLGERKDRVGIVVGIIEPAGRRTVAYGSFDKNDARPVRGNTVFEIGSTTKVFTSLLLADMVQHGEVALSDPVAKYLPSNVKVPERGRAITLEDLARHRSGLPRLPTNFNAAANPLNPYAQYSVQQLYEFLSGYTLPRDVGAAFEYSNLGVGLLGHVLTLAAGKDYETLVRTRICQPLGMIDTAIMLSPELKARLATGHDNRYEATPNWDLPTLAGAGALRSTADDMLSFLAAQLGYKSTVLDPAIALTRAKRMPADGKMEIGLGWLMRPKKDSEIVWHNGGTGGYRSFVGFDPKSRIGVVVLSNVNTQAGVDDIGFHLLDPDAQLLPNNSPLILPPASHTAITLSSDILDLYVGEYQFGPSVIMAVTRKDNQLFVQLTGQGSAEIFPESKTDFFAKAVDAQILFKTDSKGRANALVLRQLGRDQLAVRIGGGAEPLNDWYGHHEKKIDTAIYKNYVGRYQLAPSVIFDITVEEDRIFAQLTGQPKFEIFPESEKDFFYKVVDAQITFESDGKGPAATLILHQGGQNPRAPRVAD
ncbi:MAG TPA: serine hydrolase [Acidobacteriota bacterium]|nr:serine hydrolase [Acidobacteriota bacterium]